MLGLLLAGCHAPEFDFQEEASSPDPTPVSLERPLRLQVRVYHGPAKLRFKTLLDALRERGHVVSLGRWGPGVAALGSGAVAALDSSVGEGQTTAEAPPPQSEELAPADAGHNEEEPSQDEDLAKRQPAPAEPAPVDQTLSGEPDYVVQVGLKIVGRPHGFTNFAVTWVFGSMFGAPGWAGMEYTYEVATEIRLLRVGAELPLLSTTVLDTYSLTYTSDEYAWLIYFWDLGCLSGIVSTWDELADESELGPVEEAFFADQVLSAQYLRRVMSAVERAVAGDLSRGSGS